MNPSDICSVFFSKNLRSKTAGESVPPTNMLGIAVDRMVPTLLNLNKVSSDEAKLVGVIDVTGELPDLPLSS